MTRTATTVGLALLVVLSAASVAVPAGGSSAYFGVTDVTVEPSPPAPGETALVSIEVTNFQGSPNTLEVTDVAIRSAPGDRFREFVRVEDLGTLTPGGIMTVPVPLSFGTPGLRTLRIHVWGEAGGQDTHVSYPLTIRVREEHPTLSVTDRDIVAGTSNPMNVTVTNGLDADLRDVSVRLDGAGATGARTDSIAALSAGDSRSLSFDVAPQGDGEQTLTAELSYTTTGDVRRSVNRTIHYTAEPLETGVALDTARAGSGSAVRATVTNLGNVPLERVVVTGRVGDRVAERVSVGTVAAGDSKTVVVNASDVTEVARLDVTATYRQADSTGSVSATETVASNPATIELTGIDLEHEDGTLHVTGSASNLGLTPASSVVVRVRSADGVTPAYPGRTYFVGTVPASDFVAFDVYATITENATAVPLEITYLRDGVQQQTTVTVPVPEDTRPGQSQDQSSGIGWPMYALVGVVVLLAIGLMALAWRNYRAGA